MVTFLHAPWLVFFSSLELATPCGSCDSFLDVQLQASVKRSRASQSEMERRQRFFSSFFKTNLWSRQGVQAWLANQGRPPIFISWQQHCLCRLNKDASRSFCIDKKPPDLPAHASCLSNLFLYVSIFDFLYACFWCQRQQEARHVLIFWRLDISAVGGWCGVVWGGVLAFCLTSTP